MGLELSELEKLVAAVESLSDGNTEQAVLEVAEFTNEQVDTSLGVLASLNQILMAVGTMHQMKKIEKYFAGYAQGQSQAQGQAQSQAQSQAGKALDNAFNDGVQAALAYEVKDSSELWKERSSEYWQDDLAILRRREDAVIEDAIRAAQADGTRGVLVERSTDLGLTATVTDRVPFGEVWEVKSKNELDGVSLGLGVRSGDPGTEGGERERAASGSGNEKGASRARRFVEERTRSRDGRVWPTGSVPVRPADERGLEEGDARA